VTHFEAYHYSCWGTEESHYKPESAQPIWQPSLKPETSWIRTRVLTITPWRAVPGTHSTATGHSGQKHPLATAGLEPRQSSYYDSFIPASVLSTRQWTPSYSIRLLFESRPGDLHLTKYFCNFLQFLQADDRLMPQIGHNHFHIVFQLTIHSHSKFRRCNPWR
jgi:hypothetical protein